MENYKVQTLHKTFDLHDSQENIDTPRMDVKLPTKRRKNILFSSQRCEGNLCSQLSILGSDAETIKTLWLEIEYKVVEKGVSRQSTVTQRLQDIKSS